MIEKYQETARRTGAIVRNISILMSICPKLTHSIDRTLVWFRLCSFGSRCLCFIQIRQGPSWKGRLC